ncbi:RsfA family transcriptional regulator [Halalkalibacter akibai]|uniref:Prespore specific transcriptional activator RsfA n=1 Tax=Halalkalibacter akibai (strain ATCC 43226 / DSM 21942 / CIP 109018 / JCM 9157 / 1139) TaxID=1236973 RepID=W4QQB2_HALA3|nr:RsfA family transcriptional regulator [Halalkalibacter akibai]GAE33843.1 prespore specific transcriptional activator RsfA [Halalkalibacter akibai JCM 9157]
MTTIRQDAWSTDEDLILAEVVLRHIREGSTQLSAFEEVGERLSRTSAACGFRWNSAIRKKYESAIALAKKQRSKGKKIQLEQDEWTVETSKELIEPVANKLETEEPKKLKEERREEPKEVVTNNDQSLTMEMVLSFLEEYHENTKTHIPREELELLRNENDQLRQELEKIKQEKKVMTEDYRALLSIMDRARKLSIYETVQET